MEKSIKTDLTHNFSHPRSLVCVFFSRSVRFLLSQFQMFPASHRIASLLLRFIQINTLLILCIVCKFSTFLCIQPYPPPALTHTHVPFGAFHLYLNINFHAFIPASKFQIRSRFIYSWENERHNRIAHTNTNTHTKMEFIS